MKKSIITVIILLSWSQVLPASGGEPLAFLKYASGVRATGMGGAYTAVADDLSAVFYNPAGLVKLDDLEFTAETYMLSFGRSVSFLGTGKPFTIGRSLYTTAVSWMNYSGGEDIEERKTNSYEPEKYLSESANIFAFSVATVLGGNFYLGGNFKLLFHNIGDNRGNGVGFDIGLLADIVPGLSAGINVAGISANLSWSGSSYTESIPVTFMSGVAYDAAKALGLRRVSLTGAAGFNTISDFEQASFRVGAEAGFDDFAFARAGYGRAFSAGLGLKLKPSGIFSVKIDYAFEADTIITGMFNNRISLTLDYIFPHWAVRVEDADGNTPVRPVKEEAKEEEKAKTGKEGKKSEPKTEVEGFDW